MSNHRRRRPPKPQFAEKDCVCAGCKQPIRARQPVRRALGGAMYHPICRRMHVRVGDDTKQRFLVGSPVGKFCNGCEDEIKEGEKVVHLMGVPYHRECRP